MNGLSQLEGRIRALEEAFMAQSLVLNVLLRGHADNLAELLGDKVSDLPANQRAGYFGQALLDLRYQLQALAEIDRPADES